MPDVAPTGSGNRVAKRMCEKETWAKMMDVENEDDLPDDVLHLRLAVNRGSLPALEHATTTIDLLGQLIALFPPLRWEHMFANDLAARACFGRTYRQLRAAATLTFNGYYSEVDLILRGAYEAASLGRYLAKEPARAEEWVKKRQWVPDGEVRRWMSTTNYLGMDDQARNQYRDLYRELSAQAHPTAASCLSVIENQDGRPAVVLKTGFDDRRFVSSFEKVAALGLFACFAAKNAAVRDEVIDPDWRQRLAEVAREITGKELPHLERDWEVEHQKYRDLRDLLRDIGDLPTVLAANPASDDNLKRALEADDQETEKSL
jgi:hypothetical protein